MTQAMLIYATAPDRDVAMAIAHGLVAERLAACVNFVDGATSVYRWDEKIETAQETIMLVKTQDDRAAAVRDFIVAHHPFDTPAVLCLPVSDALSSRDFMDWIRKETRTPPHPSAKKQP